MPLKVWNGSSWTEVGYMKVWNGSSWASLTNAYAWDGSAWKKYFPSVKVTDVSCINLTKAGIGGTASATYRLASSGQASRQQGAGLVSITGEWLVGSGTTSDYEVQGTWAAGGGTISGPTGWVSLGTTRDWTLTVTNNFEVRDLSIEIRIAATGLVIDTATIEFEVDSAP